MTAWPSPRGRASAPDPKFFEFLHVALRRQLSLADLDVAILILDVAFRA
jgi:hypothetical protein